MHIRGHFRDIPGHFRAFWKLKYNKVELGLPKLYRSSGPMGTITERKLADGKQAFPRPSRREEKGKWLYRENQTFESKRDATLWLAEREIRMA